MTAQPASEQLAALQAVIAAHERKFGALFSMMAAALAEAGLPETAERAAHQARAITEPEDEAASCVAEVRRGQMRLAAIEERLDASDEAWTVWRQIHSPAPVPRRPELSVISGGKAGA